LVSCLPPSLEANDTDADLFTKRTLKIQRPFDGASWNNLPDVRRAHDHADKRSRPIVVVENGGGNAIGWNLFFGSRFFPCRYLQHGGRRAEMPAI